MLILLVLLLLLAALVLTRALRRLSTLVLPSDNPYRYGCRRNHTILASILPVVALVVLDRLALRR